MDGITAVSLPRLGPGHHAVRLRARSDSAPHSGNALWQAFTDLLMLLLLQVSGHVEDAVAKGATVTIGGKIPDLPEPYNKVSLHPGRPGASNLQPLSPCEFCVELPYTAIMRMCRLGAQ